MSTQPLVWFTYAGHTIEHGARAGYPQTLCGKDRPRFTGVRPATGRCAKCVTRLEMDAQPQRATGLR